uniref:Complex 1 LYR protein domain-containing protein n=1 Tax=Meloidogyne incognita TaxID=6306 RepID=A0A914NM22_MELIC
MNSYNNNSKRQVLSLYSRIIRLSKSWTAKEPKNTCIEREYILTEARNEFRKIFLRQIKQKLNNYWTREINVWELLYIMESPTIDQNIYLPQPLTVFLILKKFYLKPFNR